MPAGLIPAALPAAFLAAPACAAGWLLCFSQAPIGERLWLSVILAIGLLPAIGRYAGSRLKIAFRERTADDACRLANPRQADPKHDPEQEARLHTEAFAKASHELRTPLNAIIGYAELIQHSQCVPAGESRQMDYIRNIEMAGRHMLEVVTGVLDYSRLEAGAYDLALTELEIGDACSAALRLVNLEAGEKGIALWCEAPPDLPKVQADKRAVMQILLNLLGNAIKFSSEGDAVTVRAWQDGDNIRIAVSDTGPGIPEDEIQLIRQTFRRASNISATTDGHGLGLAVTSNLIDLHGGSMSMANALGGGAEFVVTLPIRQHRPSKQSQTERRTALQTESKTESQTESHTESQTECRTDSPTAEPGRDGAQDAAGRRQDRDHDRRADPGCVAA